MGRRIAVLGFLFAALLSAQPKRVLYITLSAGYRHDSIPTSIEVLRGLAPGQLDVTATEDLSAVTAEGLAPFDAVFFFTSGELPLADSQKAALLDYVRSGKGFGGVHSATDTLYTWPEYKNLIGATFDGHPWVQRIRIDVEDPNNPIVNHLAPGFEIMDEIYQFRDFSRSNLRVLMTVDTTSVDVTAPGVNRTDKDFALAWVHPYSRGRVFYTALGHLDSTWRDSRFQEMLRKGLLWLTGQLDAPAEPRLPAQPRIALDAEGIAIANAASFTPRAISPGTIFTVYGENFTPGSVSGTVGAEPPPKLAGAVVEMNGAPVPILYASPGQINAVAPFAIGQGNCSTAGMCAEIDIVSGGVHSGPASIPVQDRTPGVFAITRNADGTSSIWATGLGSVRAAGMYWQTVWQPTVSVNGSSVPVLFSGLAPGWMGLYQINVQVPQGVAISNVDLK